MTTSPIRILLADDQDLVRAGFALLLDVEDDLQVVVDAADGAQAVALAIAHRPDIVLMTSACRSSTASTQPAASPPPPDWKHVRVLVLGTFDTESYVAEALHAGASGFLLKDCGPTELLHGIRVIAAGEVLLAPRITRMLIARYVATHTTRQVATDQLARLTERERQILALVGQGLSNTEIAAELTLSPATARTHVGHAMTKFGARPGHSSSSPPTAPASSNPDNRWSATSSSVDSKNQAVLQRRSTPPGNHCVRRAQRAPWPRAAALVEAAADHARGLGPTSQPAARQRR